MKIYLDYNATAPVLPAVRAAVEPILFDTPTAPTGNPSSIHWAGQAAKKRLEEARAQVARLCGRRPSEVIFTSGGTEADHLALFGVLLHPAQKHRRLLISAVEHPAVRAAAAALRQKHGVQVVELPVDPDGQLDLLALEAALQLPTGLVSVMAVNNETGIVSPLSGIAERVKAAGALLHVDAVQAIGRVPLPEADLLSFSGHKLGGLPGAGVLLTRQPIPLEEQLLGGPQERGRRAGTEALGPIVGLAVALDHALLHQADEMKRLGALRDQLEGALQELPGVQRVGAHAPRVASTSTALFEGVDGDALLQALDLEGIAASSGSACSSGSLEPSHVLLAMGVAPRAALAAVRFSMGWGTTPAEIDALCRVLPRALAQVRAAAGHRRA